MIRVRHILVGLALVAASCTSDTPATGGIDTDATLDAARADTSDEMADSEDETGAHDISDRPDDAGDTAGSLDAADSGTLDTTLNADGRTTQIQMPDDYDARQSYPLVIALHGYGMSGNWIDTYLALSEHVDERDVLLVAPDGHRDSTGQRFWNATDYCCDHYGANPADAAYILSLIDEARARFSVDSDRVYLIGFSNGGFMAYRLACEHPDRFAGIVSVSGSSFDDEDACAATDGGPRILHVHGTADTVVGYYGTLLYPGARTVAERWAERNTCDADPTDAGRSDFDLNVLGDETWKREWRGCKDDSRVALWALQGGLHMPTLRESVGRRTASFA
jgi:polyhydroxybutyrate depolymerase